MALRTRLILPLICIGLLMLVGVIAPLRAATGPQPDIVGGGEVPDPNPYVWQAAIVSLPYQGTNSQYCGGSLIAAQWVLSAAHCFSEAGNVTPASEVGVLVGVRDLRVPTSALSVSRIIVHPGYVQSTFANDIALLQLSEPVGDTSLIVPLSTASDDATFAAPDTLATVSGWGGLVGYAPGGSPPGGQQYPDILYAVQVPIVDNATCRVPNPTVLDSMICAGFADGGKDSCQGDSGGPLVVPDGGSGFIQVGIVSFGLGCAAPDTYGVYTRVSSFRDWISFSTNPDLQKLFLPLIAQ